MERNGMEVFVDETLTEDKEIAFNAGTHADLIGMAYNNFEWLVNPKVVKVARY
jgi:Ala-tRNA(Pro) deacylase